MVTGHRMDPSESLDYDDDWMVDPDSDRYYDVESLRRSDKALERALWIAVVIVMLLFGSLIATANANAQDFGNVAGAKPATLTVPTATPVTVTVDPLPVIIAQDVSFLCAYIAVLSNARSAQGSAVYVAGQKPMKCVENTDPAPGSPGAGLQMVNGRASYAAGKVTVIADPKFHKVELLIDKRISAPWYRGARSFVDGKAEFILPPETLDGLPHLLDLRLYTPAMDRVYRPDGYPDGYTIVLAP